MVKKSLQRRVQMTAFDTIKKRPLARALSVALILQREALIRCASRCRVTLFASHAIYCESYCQEHKSSSRRECSDAGAIRLPTNQIGGWSRPHPTRSAIPWHYILHAFRSDTKLRFDFLVIFLFCRRTVRRIPLLRHIFLYTSEVTSPTKVQRG